MNAELNEEAIMDERTIEKDISITIDKVPLSRLHSIDKSDLKFGKEFADHMFVADYDGSHWSDLRVVPFGHIRISPATSALHYGQAIFEGMKAFRTDDGDILLFRPDENISRFNRSAERMCMASIPNKIFKEGLRELVSLDRDWVPSGENASLYLRPFMFATNEYIGVKASEKYTFCIIETDYSRACQGGTGAAKAAGNYAASLYPAKLAHAQGYDQLLWTDAREHKYIEESGTMNVMFIIDGKLVTPELTDSILPGVTRKSILTIARDWGMPVEERPVNVAEVLEGLRSGALTEAFGVGTAAVIAHIRLIGYEGEDFELPPVEERTYSPKLKKYLTDLQRGRIEDKFGWTEKI
ncbi:MAG: branched-chain amino acid transaminase [Flavobacteriales bacterium]